jgi:hypothetical protein
MNKAALGLPACFWVSWANVSVGLASDLVCLQICGQLPAAVQRVRLLSSLHSATHRQHVALSALKNATVLEDVVMYDLGFCLHFPDHANKTKHFSYLLGI